MTVYQSDTVRYLIRGCCPTIGLQLCYTVLTNVTKNPKYATFQWNKLHPGIQGTRNRLYPSFNINEIQSDINFLNRLDRHCTQSTRRNKIDPRIYNDALWSIKAAWLQNEIAIPPIAPAKFSEPAPRQEPLIQVIIENSTQKKFDSEGAAVSATHQTC